jgi:hypothetical protein
VVKPKADKAWLGNLDLRGRLLVHLASAQSRFESAMVARFRYWWAEKDIRLELRALQHEQLIDLMALDRVRWALTASGRNAARRARERAQRAVAA